MKGCSRGLQSKNVGKLYIEPGRLGENGSIESFNGRFRQEVLNREEFHAVDETKVIVENRRGEYNNHRPPSALGHRSPAEFATSGIVSASPSAQLRQSTAGQVDNY